MAITEAWNKLWHAAKAVRERCNDGLWQPAAESIVLTEPNCHRSGGEEI
jgi:hypothetical protein